MRLNSFARSKVWHNDHSDFCCIAVPSYLPFEECSATSFTYANELVFLIREDEGSGGIGGRGQSAAGQHQGRISAISQGYDDAMGKKMSRSEGRGLT